MNITACKLNATDFAPFGDVIAPDEAKAISINDGTCTRFDALSKIECDSKGQPAISLFRAQACTLPLRLELFERHPLGSQAFVPLRDARCCVIVTTGEAEPDLRQVKAYTTQPGEGFNLRSGVWHHPLVCLDKQGDFLVIDRSGTDDNLEVHRLNEEFVLSL